MTMRTHVSRESLCKSEIFCETVSPYSYGALVEFFSQKKCQQSRNTVPLRKETFYSASRRTLHSTDATWGTAHPCWLVVVRRVTAAKKWQVDLCLSSSSTPPPPPQSFSHHRGEENCNDIRNFPAV